MLKYESIYQSLLTNIQTGKFPAGTKLPSIRDLTKSYSCSISTILTALEKVEYSSVFFE